MPPLPADSIHASACKLKCEKILTRPHCMELEAHFQHGFSLGMMLMKEVYEFMENSKN